MTRATESAFPNTVYTYDGDGNRVVSHDEEGLTKREYFAALAMQGMLASWPENGRLNPDKTAEHATLFADALITALNQETQS